MPPSPDSSVIQIKKYPNRRFYDATRSRHVTLQEVHDLIIAGHDVCITDSRNGDDITNLVLTQILLERDQPKLDLFPSSVLHLMIRSNRQMLRSSIDQFLGPFLGMISLSQKQWDSYVRNAMHGKFMTPLDWANSMMSAFSKGPRVEDAAGENGFTPSPESIPPEESELDELRRQLLEMRARLDQLGDRRNGDPN